MKPLWDRLSAWLARLDTAFREAVFGTEGLGIQPHEPIVKVAHPGGCVVCPLPLGHPLHGPAGQALSELRKSGGLPVERGGR